MDSSATDPKHQISDGVAVLISTTPADGFSLLRAHPDHAGFTPELSDAVGVVDRLCPPAPVLIEVVPVGGLNGEGVGHVLCFVPLIIQGGSAPTTSAVPVPQVTHGFCILHGRAC